MSKYQPREQHSAYQARNAKRRRVLLMAIDAINHWDIKAATIKEMLYFIKNIPECAELHFGPLDFTAIDISRAFKTLEWIPKKVTRHGDTGPLREIVYHRAGHLPRRQDI